MTLPALRAGCALSDPPREGWGVPPHAFIARLRRAFSLPGALRRALRAWSEV